MPGTLPVPDSVLDLTDARCPHLLIAVIRALRYLSAGQVLQAIPTDLVAPSPVTAWARQSGQRLLELYEQEGRFIFWRQRVPNSEWADDPVSSTNPDQA